MNVDGGLLYVLFDIELFYVLVNKTSSWQKFCVQHSRKRTKRTLFSSFQTWWFTVIGDTTFETLSICREMQLDCNLTLELRFLEPSQDEKRFSFFFSSSTSQFSLHFFLISFYSSATNTQKTIMELFFLAHATVHIRYLRTITCFDTGIRAKDMELVLTNVFGISAVFSLKHELEF